MIRNVLRKRWYLFALLALIWLVGAFTAPKEYTVTPDETLEQGVPEIGDATSTTNLEPTVKGVPSEPWFERWSGRTYAKGEPIAEEDLGAAVEKLIECESGWRNVAVMDVGSLSYGILQFKSSTWNAWEIQFGFDGDPMNQLDARVMAYKALAKGYALHWSCALIVGLIIPSGAK